MTAALPTTPASGMYASNLGLVFTDSRGRIVFADNKFLTLIGKLETRKLVGEPLHAVIRVGQKAINDLLAEIANTGYVHEHPLMITREDGTQLQTVCTGVATYDEYQAFIGADLTLRDSSQAVAAQPITHSDILVARIQQIEAEADVQAAEDAMLAELYFAAVVGAIQVLLGRMGGPRVREATEDIINRKSHDAGWPIQLKGGHFIVNTDGVPLDAYQLLLSEVVDYGRNIVSSRMLAQEMSSVDEQMKPAARAIADKAGLRQWLG